MAQGKLKRKSTGVAKKAKTQKKALGPKKGARVIKPKKVTKSKVLTVKKRLEVQTKMSIEATVVSQAGKQEHKPLTIVKEPTKRKKSSKAVQKKGGKTIGKK